MVTPVRELSLLEVVLEDELELFTLVLVKTPESTPDPLKLPVGELLFNFASK